MGQIAFAYL